MHKALTQQKTFKDFDFKIKTKRDFTVLHLRPPLFRARPARWSMRWRGPRWCRRPPATAQSTPCPRAQFPWLCSLRMRSSTLCTCQVPPGIHHHHLKTRPSLLIYFCFVFILGLQTYTTHSILTVCTSHVHCVRSAGVGDWAQSHLQQGKGGPLYDYQLQVGASAMLHSFSPSNAQHTKYWLS